MNWRKLISQIIYLLYMLITLVIIIGGVHYFKPIHIWQSILYGLGAFFYILITMHMVYWSMPASIRVYWNNDPPN